MSMGDYVRAASLKGPMPTDFHSTSEIIAAVVAAFCAAFNLCIALTAWDPSHSKRSSLELSKGI